MQGAYTIRFQAGDYTNVGQATIDGGSISGHDGIYEFQGRFDHDRGHVTSILHLVLNPECVGNTRLPRDFTIALAGRQVADGFTLIGAGPLGLIVELAGEKTG